MICVAVKAFMHGFSYNVFSISEECVTPLTWVTAQETANAAYTNKEYCYCDRKLKEPNTI